MIKLGTNSIGSIYLGSNKIEKAYLGDDLVFVSGGGGPRPVFYDRLVFDGTAYIETDIIPDASDSYRMAIGNESQKGAQRYFFAPTGNSGFVGIALNSSTTSSVRCFSVFYGSSSAASSNKTLEFSYTELSLWLTPKRFGFGSTAYTFTKGASAPNGPLVIGQSPSGVGQPFTGRLGWFRIYGSDAQECASNNDFNSYTPTYTLRPCTYEGDAGLWCVETATFYGNSAGSGTLTAINNS